MSSWQSNLRLDGHGPVYDQIKRALAAPIRSGHWPPGHRIPPEEDIAAHLGTARMTVNRALRELSDDGLIVRKRRAGSFVATPPTPAALLDIVDMSAVIPARGETYGYECLICEPVPAPAELADRLQVSPGAPLLHIECRHTANDEIVELEERWINLTLLPQARTHDFFTEAPGSWLLKATPWTEAEHTVSAVNASSALAGKLNTQDGAACLVLERRTFLNDAVVTFARLTHPGDRHRMTGRFAPR